MPDPYGILANARRADEQTTPFPHLVIREALPERHYRELEESYPADQLMVENDFYRSGELTTAMPNERYQISAAEALDGRLPFATAGSGCGGATTKRRTSCSIVRSA